jgi:hypothetical protein
MESTFKHNSPLLKQGTPKHNPPLWQEERPLESIELPLTIEEQVAERLGICEEAARALVASSLQISQISFKKPSSSPSFREDLLSEVG